MNEQYRKWKRYLVESTDWKTKHENNKTAYMGKFI